MSTTPSPSPRRSPLHPPTLTAAIGAVMSVDELLAGWRPGSYDGAWTWDDEDEEVWSHPHTPGLAAQIAAEGIRTPVLLSRDGRVWDGHHRICIARRLGVDQVSVQYAADPVDPETTIR